MSAFLAWNRFLISGIGSDRRPHAPLRVAAPHELQCDLRLRFQRPLWRVCNRGWIGALSGTAGFWPSGPAEEKGVTP